MPALAWIGRLARVLADPPCSSAGAGQIGGLDFGVFFLVKELMISENHIYILECHFDDDKNETNH